MGFLKNHKKISEHWECQNPAPPARRGETTPSSHLWGHSRAAPTASPGVRNRLEAQPRAGGNGRHRRARAEVCAGEGLAGRKSLTSRRRRRRRRRRRLTESPRPVIRELSSQQAGESLVFLVLCQSA